VTQAVPKSADLRNTTSNLPEAWSDTPPFPWTAGSYALLSALLPGAGQLAQRRFGAALLQAATVGSYLVAALAAGGDRALWLAFAWNAWSAVEAYWRARRP
jgi:hypothetical protein